MDNPSAKNNGLVPFHTRHSLLMLALLLSVLLAFCFLIIQNHRLKSHTARKILENHFRERVSSIDSLLGTVDSEPTVEFLCSLVQNFEAENAPLLLIDGDRKLLAHPTLFDAEKQQLHSLEEVWPEDLQDPAATLASLPDWQLTGIGSWSVLRAPLKNVPWQAVFFQRQPPLAKVFITRLGGGSLTALLILLGMICMVAWLNHRHIVWPSEHLLHFIDALDRRKMPLIDSRIPAMWRPWFANIENIFRNNESLAKETRQQIEVLERRVKERTIELERLNHALREEIEERSKAEGALRLVNQKIQELSLVDGLTGIANYRKFDEYLEFCWKQMQRDQAPVSIIMCDVDYFKQYSDTYGHQAGDRCLQEIAQAIESSLQRPADLVARYGGEEFIILLPGTDSAGAKRVATSIQQTIASLEIPHSGSLADSCVTFSIGMATMIPAHGGSPESLLEAADQSLYRAKETGRNRVIALPIKR